MLFLYPLSPLHIDPAVLSSAAISAQLAVGCRGPALPFAGLAVFSAPSRTTPSREQLLCPWLCPLLTVAVQGLSRGPGMGQECLRGGTAEELGRINLCVKLRGWSGPQGSWLSVPLFSSLWKNSLFKRSECLLWKMGRRRQIRPEVCVQEQWKKRCC